MSEAEMSALDRRVGKLEAATEPIPAIQAKQHAHANTLQLHSAQLDAIIGPKDSMLTQVGEMKGTIGLLDERLQRIDGGLDLIRADVAKLVKAHELARADVAGQWQLRATMAAAVIAAMSAVAVAALQYLAG